MHRLKSTGAVLLIISLLFSGVCVPGEAKTPKIHLNKTNITLKVGGSTKLKINGTKKEANWSSSDEGIATVNTKGKVTAKRPGIVTIRARHTKKTLKCRVKVTPVIAKGLPEFTVHGSTDLPGEFYLSFAYTRNIILLDGRGNIVWSKHEDQPRADKYTGFWDFKKHEINGKTYYSYHDNTGTYDDFGLEGFGPGERVILDDRFHEIKRITFEKSNTVEKGHPLDGHDFLMIDLDHYILSGYIKDTVYNVPGHPEGSSVVYSYLQEVKNGKVVWDFRSIDYPELYDLTVTEAVPTAADFANETTDVPDYVHFNSMRIDKNGNLVCSFRHINSILCLDRSRQTDQIRWKLSGSGDEFGLTEDQKTSSQHYASLDNDEIMVFDNGNRTEQTRIGRYHIDESGKRLLSYEEKKIAGKYSSACGAVQHLRDDLYMIGWGRTENDAVCMSVYDFANEHEWISVELANPRNFTYRCAYY